MELIPFNPKWADSGSKLDLHAIYQRGDVISSFPVRRHNDWIGNGWRYVTLATAMDAREVANELRAMGVDMNKLQASYEPNRVAAFKVQEYLKEQPNREAQEAEALEARLAEIQSKQPKRAQKADPKPAA